eukprot:COSAG05_NODE_11_length_38500_cov_831.349861_13_plen_59_part_00
MTFELAADTLTIIAVKGRRASLRRTIVCSVPKNPPLTVCGKDKISEILLAPGFYPMKP